MYGMNKGNQYPYGCFPQQMQAGYVQCPPGTVIPQQQCPPQACVPVCYPVGQPCVWYPSGPAWGYGCSHGPGQAHDKSCGNVASGGKGQEEPKKVKGRHRHKRGHKHVTCHKKGTESQGPLSSSCTSDSE